MPKLINQGANGCIYKPHIQCDNEPISNKYISKVQIVNQSMLEIRIGEQLMKIPNYELYFAPIISHCPVELSKIEDELVNCNSINEDLARNPSSKFVSNKIKYVGKMHIYDFFVNHPTCILEAHLDLLHSLDILWKTNIVHFDLKYNNIIYDEQLKCPIIIDFGSSYLTHDVIHAVYHNYKDLIRGQYCIDVVLISYILTKDLTQPINKDEVDNVCDEFAKNSIFEYCELPDNFIVDLKVDLKREGTWRALMDTLIANQSYWDNYALSVTILVFISNSAHAYKTMLEKVIFAMPSKRPSIQDVRNELLLIKEFKNISNQSLELFKLQTMRDDEIRSE